MSTQTGASSRSRGRLWLIVAGIVVLAMCLGVAVSAAAGYWWFVGRPVARGEQPAVEYILDASPRMTLPAAGADANRLAVARGVLAEIVRPADPAVSAGLRVFGSGALPAACQDTDLLVPLRPAAQPEIADRLQLLQAGAAADAAMAEAMIAAIRDLASIGGPHTLVVVTGGADSCNPEAGQLIAREAETAGIALQMFVVGYQVSAGESQALKGLADDGGATYLEAQDEDELRAILEAIQTYVDGGTLPQLQRVDALATPGGVATAVAAAGATPEPGSDATGTPSAATPAQPAGTAPSDATAAPGGYPAQTACDHPYFPLRQGATWTYASQEGQYTWTVTEVTGNLQSASATMVLTMEDLTATYHWNCSADGMVSYDFGSFAVSSGGETAQMEILSSEGAWLLPADQLRAGASWTHAYSIRMVTGDVGVSSESNYRYTASGAEQVESRAGSFDTLRVDGSGTTSSSVPGAGAFSMDMNITYWLAYGVGMVRSQSSMEGMADTTTLVSYSIP
jgi:hypothetical protein